jgi:hypothetical protein
MVLVKKKKTRNIGDVLSDREPNKIPPIKKTYTQKDVSL